MNQQRFEIGWYNGWSPKERLATVTIQRDAIRTGRLARPTHCSICGVVHERDTPRSVWLHDEDYANPLAAYPICRTCHRLLHQRFESPEPWRKLIRRHGAGGQWFEMLTLDPASLRQPFTITYPAGLPRA